MQMAALGGHLYLGRSWVWNILQRILGHRKAGAEGAIPLEPLWILVPLGNPGPEYADTRHNLGRIMLQRWMDRKGLEPSPLWQFQTGTLYRMEAPFLALVPGTYMNLSGQVCREAITAGMDPARMIVLFDDKDLSLGMGRFRREGSAGGHNGVQSVIDHLGTASFARLRLGIGPFVRPLHQFVLQEWSPEEQARIESLDEPFARFMARLAGCQDLGELGAKVNGAAFWESAGSETSLETQAKP